MCGRVTKLCITRLSLATLISSTKDQCVSFYLLIVTVILATMEFTIIERCFLIGFLDYKYVFN